MTAKLQAPLTELLREKIRQNGPITFRDWMDTALYHPHYGYYCSPERDRWGAAGDYRTSPERSALFAATFARYFVQLFKELGVSDRLTILEIGAGAGHFAEGVLETIRRSFPQDYVRLQYLIDEVSQDSRIIAASRLAQFGDVVSFKGLLEIDSLKFGIIFGNELLDAFPVHRITRHANELQELFVGLNSAEEFSWLSGPLSTPRLKKYCQNFECELQDGQIVEINLDVEDWLTQAAAKLAEGYVILVDYGAEDTELYGRPERREGTLRSFSKHKFVADILAQPGEQDITTTVDWSFVKTVSEKVGFSVVEHERQDRFLLQHGFLTELDRSINEAETESERIASRIGASEMILPDRMGASFQVLVLHKG